MTLPTPTIAPDSFSGQRIGVFGLGIEGRDAVALLEREGADILLVDQNRERGERAPDDLAVLDEVDGLIVSQGVHYRLPLLIEAQRQNVPVYGPTQIFLERCPANVIGITGSAGKTTTTTLVAELLRAAGVRTHVGGNIGRGLLAQLPELDAADTVVVEISHSQLLRTTRSPQIAAITNITPNHLDQFSWDEYQQLKYRLVQFQDADDRVVLPTDNELAAAADSRTAASVTWFGLTPRTGVDLETTVRDNQIVRQGRVVVEASALQIPGQHNLLNALAALAIVGDRVSDDVAARVLRDFSGVPHRLEAVGAIDGVRYVNDSIGSTPERTLAGLRATRGPIILLLGGRDKQLPLDPLLAELERRVRRVILFGESAPLWTAWLSERGVDAVNAGSLEDAFELAAEIARPCETVLLSPGGTSFDAYPNFEVRGEHFRQLVRDRSDVSEMGNEVADGV